MNKSNICYNLTIIDDQFFIDSIYDYNDLSNQEIRIIHSNCNYICDMCKNDYMYTCLECELAKEFEFEIEKQKYMEYKKNKNN
jgi:hypothetical protein